MSKLRCMVFDTVTAIQEQEWITVESKHGSQHADWKQYAVGIINCYTQLKKLGYTLVYILGDPGTGKSYGIKYLKEGECIWLNADNKNPTWIGGSEIFGTIRKPKPYHIIPKTYEDVVTVAEKAIESGAFGDNLPLIYMLGHVANYKAGKPGSPTMQKLSTIGKLTDERRPEAAAEIVLYADVRQEDEDEEPNWFLRTRPTGLDSCRVTEPLAVRLEKEIPNNYDTLTTVINEVF